MVLIYMNLNVNLKKQNQKANMLNMEDLEKMIDDQKIEPDGSYQLNRGDFY